MVGLSCLTYSVCLYGSSLTGLMIKLHELYGLYSQSSVQWMRKNYPGFVWGYRTNDIEPLGQHMMVCLEPEDSFADIVGSEEVILHN